MQKLLETVPTFVLPVNEEENQIIGYTFSDEIRLTSYTLSLLSCLLSEGNLIQEHSDLHSSSLEGMQMLLKRLVSHPEEKLSMEEAAAFTNMSYSNFCRSFKTTIGYSYVDFCNIIRVRRAQELLQNSQKSVTEISTLLNFGSVSYFNRIFKKLTGCTPWPTVLHAVDQKRACAPRQLYINYYPFFYGHILLFLRIILYSLAK